MAFEDRAVVLLIKPAEKFLKAFVGADFLYGIELIAQLVVGPGFVDEVLTAVAGGHGFPAAFAARHDVMTARRHFPQTENARVVHARFRFMENAFNAIQTGCTRSTSCWIASKKRNRYPPSLCLQKILESELCWGITVGNT